jgi:two-component system chemotaxis response regulator CheB
VASIDALRLGAVDVILKPKNPQSVPVFAQRLKRRIRELAMNSSRWRPRVIDEGPPRLAATTPVLGAAVDGLIAIGASTGGPQALEALLTHLPSDLPPIVIVQHMPAEFTRLFAKRLDDTCRIQVTEAHHGQELARGAAYIAPGDEHLTVDRCPGGRLRAALSHGRQVHHQRPSVDVLFQSLLKLKDVPIVGVLLTGMGRDGAEGMVGLTIAGHQTIAEDERSCVVFGMPREAIARGGAKHVVSLDHMPGKIVECLRRNTAVRRIG